MPVFYINDVIDGFVVTLGNWASPPCLYPALTEALETNERNPLCPSLWSEDHQV